MVLHRNPSIAEDAARILNTKAGDHISNEVANLVPVIPIQRYCEINKSVTVTNATSGTIYTTPTDKDFYLVSATLGVIKDATSTSTDTRLVATIGGVTTQILIIPSITLVAQSAITTLNLNLPLKIDRNTNITVTNTTNVANIKSAGTIQGYTVETTKAT